MAKATAYFTKIFGKSPFPVLQKHGSICVAAAEELLELVPAANRGEWEKVAASSAKITELEHKADRQKRKIRRNLPRGFFLPVARADLLELLSRQDGIANGARDVAGLISARQMQFPVELQPALIELLEAVVRTCATARELVSEFDELLDSGFTGLEAKRVSNITEEIAHQEGKTDDLVVALRGELFAIEKQLAPLDAIFAYRALDMIANLADVALRVAHGVQMMVAK